MPQCHGPALPPTPRACPGHLCSQKESLQSPASTLCPRLLRSLLPSKARSLKFYPFPDERPHQGTRPHCSELCLSYLWTQHVRARGASRPSHPSSPLQARRLRLGCEVQVPHSLAECRRQPQRSTAQGLFFSLHQAASWPSLPDSPSVGPLSGAGAPPCPGPSAP